MVEISTSVLTVEREKIMQTIYDLEVAKTDYFHIDVMDGKFVTAFTSNIMEEYSGYMKSVSTLPLDVHLMVEDVRKYVDIYLNYEPNIITFHIEAVKDEEEAIELIDYIKSNNCKVGIALNPATDIKKVLDLLDKVHMVLVMTVVPGEGGQPLMEDTLSKISELKKYIDENNLDIDIEADGGIKLDNVQSVKDAGANIIVSGTGIVKQDDFGSVIAAMKD
ncbi:MAG: ribulose-phosphate 3-epimerase [Clostridia bacterium]|nr:ribulose-phosphate 3-epimerase [Clostridia bacterium]